MQHTIQEVLMAHLAANGQHEAAQEAITATERTQFTRLTELAIRTAPAWDRTRVAQALYLELDRPENGGRNEAADFVIVQGTHPFRADEPWYTAYKSIPGGVDDESGLVPAGLAAPSADRLINALVGAHVVRSVKVL